MKTLESDDRDLCRDARSAPRSSRAFATLVLVALLGIIAPACDETSRVDAAADSTMAADTAIDQRADTAITDQSDATAQDTAITEPDIRDEDSSPDDGSGDLDGESGDIADSTDADMTTPPASVCGDGVIEGDELCDDGVNDDTLGSCAPDCAGFAICGGDILITTLTSDDGDDIFEHREVTNAEGVTLLSESLDIDGTPQWRTVWTLTPEGRVATVEVDEDVDGTLEQLTTYTYDAAGRLIQIDDGAPVPGGWSSRVVITYDAQGRETLYVLDTLVDGTAERTRSTTWDATGSTIIDSYDFEGDGVANQVTTTTRNVDMQMLREERDNDADGVPDYIQAYTYDANGMETSQRTDHDADGVFYIRNTAYTADGQIASKGTDADGDGVDEISLFYFYDAEGRLIEDRQEGVDGTVYYVRTYQRDADGNVIVDSYDVDNDGVGDRVRTYTYDGGVLVQSTDDEDGDGVDDLVVTNEYDADGLLILVTTVIRGTEYIGVYEYDSGGRGVLHTTTLAGAEIFRLEWDYDPAGRPLGHRRDDQGDGQWDQVVQISFECP